MTDTKPSTDATTAPRWRGLHEYQSDIVKIPPAGDPRLRATSDAANLNACMTQRSPEGWALVSITPMPSNEVLVAWSRVKYDSMPATLERLQAREHYEGRAYGELARFISILLPDHVDRVLSPIRQMTGLERSTRDAIEHAVRSAFNEIVEQGQQARHRAQLTMQEFEARYPG